MSSDPQGPGIRVPPPFIFAGGWLVAWWLHRRLPFDIDGSGASAWQTALGLAACAAGLGLVAWGITTFTLARTPVIPHRPARALVRHGPYRFTRNPMYVGLTSLHIGLALVANMAWPLVMLPVVLIVLTTYVIRREEAHLTRMFGEDYHAFRRDVRRWL